MLYRASVNEVKSGRVTRRYGHLAVVMQYYPRFLSKDKIDEYVHALAPDRALFTEFKQLDRELKDHDLAFERVKYEDRFGLTGEGLASLERLTEISVGRTVYLLCQCGATERCHADLLLLLARHHFHAQIPLLRKSYPRFEERVKEGV